jgi:hypothetical protein
MTGVRIRTVGCQKARDTQPRVICAADIKVRELKYANTTNVR